MSRYEDVLSIDAEFSDFFCEPVEEYDWPEVGPRLHAEVIREVRRMPTTSTENWDEESDDDPDVIRNFEPWTLRHSLHCLGCLWCEYPTAPKPPPGNDKPTVPTKEDPVENRRVNHPSLSRNAETSLGAVQARAAHETRAREGPAVVLELVAKCAGKHS